MTTSGAEKARLAEADAGARPWRNWGPYVAERAWGTVREDYSDERLFQEDPDWHDLLPFHEYFHGDTGKGLGAWHQTGWTGLVVDLVLRRPDGLA